MVRDVADQIASVTGPVGLGSLGPILYHEHLVLDVPRVDDLWLPGAEIMGNELTEYHRRGGGTAISLTNGSMGRDIAVLQAISRQSGVTVLAATGQYTRKTSAPIVDAGQLAERFVSELRSGIGESGVRAAVIGEIATGRQPIARYEQLLFQAAAIAHRATGAPIATHTHTGLYARWQLRYLTSLGVDPARVVIGHMDASLKNGEPDVDSMSELAAAGAFIGIDTVGLANYYSENLGRYQPSDESRADAIAELVHRGWSDHILIAHDICRRRHLKMNGGCGYGHIHDVFFPLLESRGINRTVANKFLVDNPMRWLAGTL
jgi:predicted metal-dependent phosphotriesterase family hydrolase